MASGGHRQGRSGGGRRSGGAGASAGAGAGARRYPRSARVNEILREVLADALERLSDTDERLALLTVTGVDCDPDLRHALVFFSSLDENEATALADSRVRLQASVSHQVRLKRTPQLRFAPDPAVAAGKRIEDILRELPHPAADTDEGAPGS
jgi:ribosome-binding factor A